MPAEGRCRHILSRRETWLLIAGRMITDPVWYFLSVLVSQVPHGCSPGRIVVMTGAAASSPLLAVGVASVAAFSHLAWQISLSTPVVDICIRSRWWAPLRLVAAGSDWGGMLSTHLVGRAITYYSNALVFPVTGFLYPVAWLLVRLVRPQWTQGGS